jgi:hypothetical protein
MCCEVRPLLTLPIMQTVASVPSIAVSLCKTVILYGKRWRSEWRILCSDRREIPNSAEALLVDLLGLRVKATRTVSMSPGVRTLAGRGRFFSNTTISLKSLAKPVNCLFARSPPCIKNVCTKTSLSRYYTLCFCIKQTNFHLLIYSQTPVVRHFTNWWHLSHFPWTATFTGTFATSILWCYNFNGMKKLYDISCTTLYIEKENI